MVNKNNPLLTDGQFPEFALIKPKHVIPAITYLITEHKEQFTELLSEVSKNPTWENFIYPLEEIDDHLHSAWHNVSHLNSVISSDELRKVYETAATKMATYGVFLAQHKGFYKAVLKIKESEEYDDFDSGKRKVIDNLLRDFRLSGVALVGKERAQYKKIVKKLTVLDTRFSNNVLKATNSWNYLVEDEEELSGIPDPILAFMQHSAKSKKMDGFLVTLDGPVYVGVLQHADSRKLREMVYRAYATRASKYGNRKFNNDKILLEILKLRYKLAKLLGFKNYAELSLATKMATTTSEVIKFLNELASPAKRKAKKEYQELKQFAKRNYRLKNLKPWDVSYFSEKLKESEYKVDAKKLRQYFPEDRVLQGLFEIAYKLYGITIKEQRGKSVWHKDVRYFSVFDDKDKLCGGIYLDLYARENKRGGAWMDECKIRRILPNGRVRLPIAHLVCNLTKAAKRGEPALFTHREVETLFHEFGHVTQHILTKVDYADVSGIQGVAWDSVEFASQFMENWGWQKKSLTLFAKHYRNGKTLPTREINRLVAAKNFNVGLQTVRQLEFGLFDMLLHRDFDPRKGLSQVRTVLSKVRDKVSVVKVPKFVSTQNSFLHIFAGPYAAGYYSYKWAEVLAADAFQKFLRQGIFDQRLGHKFRDDILAVGGSIDPMEAFFNFMGRRPRVESLLKQQGFSNN